jgi:hypothetical protein
MYCFALNLYINSDCAKHFPLPICCEKYLFDGTKADASTDFVYDKPFSQHILYFLQQNR